MGVWVERQSEVSRCDTMPPPCGGRAEVEFERDAAVGSTLAALGLAVIFGAFGLAVYPWETTTEGESSAWSCGPSGCTSRF